MPGEEEYLPEKRNNKLLLRLFLTFLKIGALGFGGGFSVIPLIEREVVDKKKWLNKSKLIDVLAISQCLPGGVAVNSAGFVGYAVSGISGALISMLGNVIVPCIVVLTFMLLFSLYGSMPIIQHVFYGVRPAIIGLILYSAYNMGKNSINGVWDLLLCLSAVVSVLLLHINVILVIFCGAAIGITAHKLKVEYKARRG
jgi:chromate transporter